MEGMTSHIAAALQLARKGKTVRYEPVARELLVQLMDEANWTASPRQREPWRFILFVDEGKDVIAQAIVANGVKKRDPVKLKQVPAYLLVVTPEGEDARKTDHNYTAASAWIQSFRLLAAERGLAVLWKQEPYTYQPGFWRDCGVQEGERMVGMLQIGYPDEEAEVVMPTPVAAKLTLVHAPSAMEGSTYDGSTADDR